MELLACCRQRERDDAPDGRRRTGQRDHLAPLPGGKRQWHGACHRRSSCSTVQRCNACTCVRVQGTLSPGTLLLWNLLGAAVLLTSAAVLRPQLEPEVFGRAVRRALLLLAGTYLLSPLLQVSAMFR